MNAKANDLLLAAMDLSPEERAELAVELMASIESLPDEEADAAWLAEIERRAQRAHAGVTAGKDLATVRERIERELRRR